MVHSSSVRLVITTSRRPTQRIREFCKDLFEVIPCSIKLNRGKLSIEGICSMASDLGATGVAVVEREKGGPGRIVLLKSDVNGTWLRASALRLSHIRTRREHGSKGRGPKVEAIVAAQDMDRRERGPVDDIATLLGLVVVEPPAKPVYRCVIEASPCDGEVEFVVKVYPGGNQVGPSFVVEHAG
jgi:rRNA maturation protein Rpf1